MGQKVVEMLNDLCPFWKDIQEESKEKLIRESMNLVFAKGEVLHAAQEECSGLFLIKKGRVRVFIVTPEGKEVTLFRLLDRDMCIFSASCMMKDIQFSVYISAETSTEVIRIPAKVYSDLEKTEIAIVHFTKDILSARMSDVMWVLEQILFMSFDKRLAVFLLEQSQLEESEILSITHEQIANHLGSAREVVTRMLKYFVKEGYVELARGKVLLKDKKNLSKRCAD